MPLARPADKALDQSPCPIPPRPPSCPVRSAASRASQKFRPFCSKRCADVDLNRWLKGVYAVPVTENDDEDGDKAEDQPGAGSLLSLLPGPAHAS